MTKTYQELEKQYKSCRTLEDLKKLYFTLLKQHHTDIGGDTETCQHVNNLYEFYFPLLKNTRRNKDCETYQKETEETSNMFMDIINNIIHYVDIKIEICGTWLWISGETKPYKDNFKEMNFKWSTNKSMWYYTTDTTRKTYNRNSWTIDEIRNTYGSQEIDTKPLQAVKG